MTADIGPNFDGSTIENTPSEEGGIPQVIFCLLCAQGAKKDYDRQKKDGKKPHEMFILPPTPAFTWTYALVGSGFPVSFPVCLAHLVVEQGSGLLKG